MHANLVRAARLQPDLDERGAAQPFDDLPVRDRVTPGAGARAEFFAVVGVAAVLRAKRALFGDHPFDERQVATLQLDAIVTGEQQLQTDQRGLVLGHHHHARRLAIEPMHDAGAPLAADAGQRIAAVVKERVDQRARLVRRRRMDDQPRRLVEHQQMRVLEKNGQRNVFGQILRRHGRRRTKNDALVGVHFAAGFGARPAHLHLALLDAARDLRPRIGQPLARQPHVEPLALAGGVHDKGVLLRLARHVEQPYSSLPRRMRCRKIKSKASKKWCAATKSGKRF